MVELLGCPFCGGRGRLYQRQNASALWHAACVNCDSGPHSDLSRGEAVARWNTRSPPSALEAKGPADAVLLPVTVVVPAEDNHGGYIEFPSGRLIFLSKVDAAALSALEAKGTEDAVLRLKQIVSAWDKMCAEELQTDEGLEQAIEAGRAAIGETK